MRAEAIGFLKAFSMPNSILIEGLMGGDLRLLGSCRRLGVGHMSTELGGGGRLSLRALRAAERGLPRLLKHVGVLTEANSEPAPPSRFFRRHPTRDYVYSTANGVFEPFFELGDTVKDKSRALCTSRRHRGGSPRSFASARVVRFSSSGLRSASGSEMLFSNSAHRSMSNAVEDRQSSAHANVTSP